LNLNPESCKIAHFAPETSLTKFFKRKGFKNITTIDLFMPEVDLKADITNLATVKDNTFDGLICSHVLEHINEDEKAINELFRILKPGGWGIIMAPICLSISQTLENQEVKNVEDRWRLYGQDDHVRLYSKDGFLSKLSLSGFKTSELGIKQFGGKIFQKLGLKKTSVLYFAKK
jgi:SAM-dependent methyltransferase